MKLNFLLISKPLELSAALILFTHMKRMNPLLTKEGSMFYPVARGVLATNYQVL
jgi:hypothetical protein